MLFAITSFGALTACSSSEANSNGPGGPGSPDGSAPPVTECSGQTLPERARDLSVSSASSLEPYFPTTEFRTATPTEAGFDQAKFDAAIAFTTPQSNTQALLILRHGYVVREDYFGSFTPTSRHESYSMAKSFSSALVGIAINAKLLTGVDQRLCEIGRASCRERV